MTAMLSRQKSAKGLAFDPEELLWPEVNPHTNPEEILQINGMFKFSKVKDLLGLSSLELTRLSRIAREKGFDTYEHFGFAKPKGSQYILKMSVFRETYRHIQGKRKDPCYLEPEALSRIPSHVQNANQLIQLKGFFRLNDVCQFSPLNESAEAIKNATRHESPERARHRNGCWFDRTKREFLIDMQLFVPWFFQEVWMN